MLASDAMQYVKKDIHAVYRTNRGLSADYLFTLKQISIAAKQHGSSVHALTVYGRSYRKLKS